MVTFRIARRTLGSLSLLALTLVPSAALRAQEQHGIDPTTIDKAIKPTTDFYQFANGGWLTKTQIPADRPSIGAFEEVNQHNETILHGILEQAAKETNAPADSPARRIGDFYRVGMDEALAETQGVKPLLPLFEEINSIKESTDLLPLLAHLHRVGVGAGFGIEIGPDLKDSKKVIFQMGQGGLSLPDRDYYTNEDARSVEIRKQYVAHVTRMLTLLGEKPEEAATDAKKILALETKFAKASLTRLQMRDPNAVYHKMSLTELKACTPGVEWERYFDALGLPDPGTMNIGMPEFMKAFGKTLSETPLSEWQVYLHWQTLSSFAAYLNKAYVEEDFRFSSLLSGQKEQSPRWKRVMRVTEGALGDALGQLFVAKAFPPEAKERSFTLVKNIMASLRDRLLALDWMGETTKAQALKKLDAIQIKVGYPDKWRDYSGLELGTDSYAQNVMRVNAFAFARELKKVGKPVDRTEWMMTPPTVNAYYNPQFNEIVFPAGILQPPFFDAKADDASNYGAIGMVIGHEMTHGFDDQGRQFDAEGNLKDWWTAEDAKRFAERGQALVKQYSGYLAVEKTPVNGALTIGENISDLGGLNIAYQAWKKTPQGMSDAPSIDGFTPKQRFFLAFAQVWRFKSSPEYARMLAGLDAHSPARWRVLGTLVNVPEFTEAFGPADAKSVVAFGSGKVRIW